MTLKTLRLGAWVAVAALTLLLSGVMIYQSVYKGTEKSVVSAARLGAPFNLIDHNGEPITEKAFANQPTALFFGFTHCPEVCPTSLNELAILLDDLGRDGAPLKAFFVTVDPERDTPELMKNYVTAFSPRITGITGDPAEIAKLIKAWRVYAKKIPLDGGDYTMDHTASIYLVRRDGSFQGTIAFREDPKIAVQKLRRLATGNPS